MAVAERLGGLVNLPAAPRSTLVPEISPSNLNKRGVAVRGRDVGMHASTEVIRVERGRTCTGVARIRCMHRKGMQWKGWEIKGAMNGLRT